MTVACCSGCCEFRVQSFLRSEPKSMEKNRFLAYDYDYVCVCSAHFVYFHATHNRSQLRCELWHSQYIRLKLFDISGFRVNKTL